MNHLYLPPNLNVNVQTFVFNVNLTPQLAPLVIQPVPMPNPEAPLYSPNTSPSKMSSASSSSSVNYQTAIHNDTENNMRVGRANFPKALANSAMFDPIRYKTEMCKNYQELGYCKFGPKCYYAHFANELKEATYKHKKYKTQLCKPFHLEGFCDFGSRCAFIHSKPDMDELVSKLQEFLSSAPPMPHFITGDEKIKDGKEDNGDLKRRLKVFQRFTN